MRILVIDALDDTGTQAALLRASWPGNVQELEDVIRRAAPSGTGPRTGTASPDVDAPGTAAAAGPATETAEACVRTAGRTIEAVEKDMILDALQRNLGNRTRTASVLGISIRTLRNKLHEYERGGTRIPRPVVVAVA